MGVKGFSSFIKKHFRHWKTVNYKEKVIIDGSSICYSLYKDIPWALGGEYDKFASKVEDFFASYFRNPIVVFDGSSRESIGRTVRARRKSAMVDMEKVQKSHTIDTSSTGTGNTLPPLAFVTFMATLEELSIEYYVTDGESDKRIAALADRHKCPVLSADSDFFIFDLRYGFIHFGRLLSSTRPLYYIKDFMKQFRLKTYELCLMIPSFFGTDFMESAVDGKPKFSSFLENLSKCTTCAQFKCCTAQGRRSKSANIMLALKYYSSPIESTSYADLVPQWIYDKYKEGRFSAVVFEAFLKQTCLQPQIVETIEQDPAWSISRPIRQQIYHIFQLNEVTEVIRLNGRAELGDELVLPKSQDVPAVIERVPLEVLFFSLLQTEDIPGEFSQLEDKWKLPIAATCFWYKHTFNPRLLLALLMSFLTLHGYIARQNFSYPRIVKEKKGAYFEAFHAFAKWQCVYSDAISLNSLAVEPMRIINPAELYSGEIAMGYALKRGLLQAGSGPMMEHLHTFWTIITGTDLPTSIIFSN